MVSQVQNTEKFSCSTLIKNDFYHTYCIEGWIGRKVKSIPMIFWTGTIQSVYHLSRAFFTYIGASISSSENQSQLKSQALKYFFSAARDFQEAFGWVLTLFNDFHGSYYVEKARLHKKCYENFGEISHKQIAGDKREIPEALITRREETEKIRCPIAKVTGIATTEGFYITPSGKEKKLRSGEDLCEGSDVRSNVILISSVAPRYPASEITVIEQDCLKAAEDALNFGAKKVAVLMFASPIEPGGAMEEGNNGQEEDLCRRSNIFAFMWDQSHFLAKNMFYNLVDVTEPHQENPDYLSMTNNRMLHVPQVTVFRDGKIKNYEMLEEPFDVGMLVSPALDRPEYKREGEIVRYTRDEDVEQLNKLIMTQLKVAYDENYDTVVLGAFGCGAFYNPPEIIAEAYKTIINSHFKGAFKKIVFPVLNDKTTFPHNPEGNLKPFQTCFAEEMRFIPNGEKVNLYSSITGNPTHLGHLHMVALAIQRLVAEGYRINQVKIILSSEEYAVQKVWLANNLENSNGKLPSRKTVLIPREERITFLRAVIQQAKEKKLFPADLNVDYFDESLHFVQKDIKHFHVYGSDFADECSDKLGSHAVIVTRNGKMPNGINESHTSNLCRLIVDNESSTNRYSSSKIQNGEYKLLPKTVRKKFKELQEEAQKELVK